MMAKAAKERDDAKKEGVDPLKDQKLKNAASAQQGQKQKGGGVVNLEQKGQKDMVYDSYREGIDDLYARKK